MNKPNINELCITKSDIEKNIGSHTHCIDLVYDYIKYRYYTNPQFFSTLNISEKNQVIDIAWSIVKNELSNN